MKPTFTPVNFCCFLGSLFLCSAPNLHATENPTLDAYASLRLGIDYIDAGTDDDGANGRDFLSRVGIKGSMPLDNGLTGVLQLEYGARDDNLVDFNQNGQPTLRLASVGIKGSFGEVHFGSQTLIWHRFVRGSYFSDANDTIRQGAIRDDDLLQYYYRAGSWLIGAGLQFEGQDGDSMDQFQLGSQYERGDVKLQLAYSKDNRGDLNGDLWGAKAWWNVTNAITLSAYTHIASEDFDLYAGSSTGNVRLRDSSIEGNVNGIPDCRNEERQSSGIYFSLRNASHQIHTRYAVDSCDISGDVESIKVEYVHHLSKKFRAWLSFEDLSNDEARLPASSSGEEMSELQIGLRFDL